MISLQKCCDYTQPLKKAFGAGKGGSVLISRQISDAASINHFSSTREPLFQWRLARAKGQCQAVQRALRLWEGKNSSALTAVCENRSGCFTTEAPHSSTIHCRCSEEIRWNQSPQCFTSHWSWHYSLSPRVFVPIHKPPQFERDVSLNRKRVFSLSNLPGNINSLLPHPLDRSAQNKTLKKHAQKLKATIYFLLS